MKAIVFSKYGNPLDVLQYKEVEMPKPNDDEVLLKILATSINDWDWGLVTGKPFVIRLLIGLTRPKKVNIPGVDVVGKVEAIGKNITKFKIGDEVFGDLSESGFGSFAEYVCAKENAISLKPTNMSIEDAAALPHASMLAVQGLIDKGEINEEKTVLINGAGGGVGTIGVQIAKTYNIKHITGVDNSDKLEMLLSLGFDNVIDYKKEDFTSSGSRYDLILDVKTNRSIIKYEKALNKNGKYVTVGGSMGKILQITFFNRIISLFKKKKLIVLGLKPNKDLDYINKIYEEGKLKPILDKTIYELKNVPEALSYFGTAKHQGKIIIKV